MLSNSRKKEVELTSQWRSGKTAMEKLSYEDYSEYDTQNKEANTERKRKNRRKGTLLVNHE